MVLVVEEVTLGCNGAPGFRGGGGGGGGESGGSGI